MQTMYMRICNCTLSWLLNSVEVEIVLILMCIILGVIWLCAAMDNTIIDEVHCLSKIGQCIRVQGASKKYQHKGIGTAGIGDIYLYLL